MRNSLIFALVCLPILILSCKTTSSNVMIINGLEDTDDMFPAVLYLKITSQDDEQFLCSSSVISHNTLVTASHCFEHKPKSIETILPSGTKVKAKAFFSNKNYFTYVNQGDKTTARKYDIGIVLFNDHTFDKVTPLKISGQNIESGTAIAIVGYACQTDVDKKPNTNTNKLEEVITQNQCQDFIRRYGFNVIHNRDKTNRVCPDGNIEIFGLVKHAYCKDPSEYDGICSTSWYGDSGGPAILFDTKSMKSLNIIIGNTSSAGVPFEGYITSCYTTFSPEIIEWLKKIHDSSDAVIPLDPSN